MTVDVNKCVIKANLVTKVNLQPIQVNKTNLSTALI